MRRALWSRLLAGWLACWLPLVLADVGGLHACPMHDVAAMMAVGPMAPMVVAPTAASAVHVMVAHDGMAAAAMSHPAAHAASHAASRGRSQRDHASGQCCSCLGVCCAAVAVLPVRPAAITLATAARAPVAPTGRPEHEYVAAWVDFVLPFATAPPTRG